MDKLVTAQADKISRMNNLLLRAVAENKRREEIVEGFRQMLFKTGNTSESNIVTKYMKASKPEQEKVECGRSSDYPLKFLKGFEGYLHTDGYTGYDKTVRESRGKIIRCECLVHARRHFADILKLAKDKQNNETLLAAKAVELLDRVFVVEKEANLSCVDGSGVRDPEKVKALRQEKNKADTG